MTADDFDRPARLSPQPRPEPSAGADGSRGMLDRWAEDRDRPAHDLNDTLIRQMFAVSLDLHAALSRLEHGAGDRHAADKIRKAITGLDQAITDLRDAIVRRGARDTAGDQDPGARPPGRVQR